MPRSIKRSITVANPVREELNLQIDSGILDDQTALGIKLSPRIVCALGESAPPLVTGFWSLASGLWFFRWRATAGSAGQ